MTSTLLGVAQTRYEDKSISKDDAAYAVVLDALTQAIDDDERDFRNTDGCNFYSALSPTLSNLNTQLGAESASMDKDKATLGAMATKYGVAVKDLQTTELSPDDSLIVTPIYNRFKQTWRTLQYARDLIHIEGLFQFSQLIYESRVQSIGVYGATPDKIDDVLDKQMATKSAADRQYASVWVTLNEKFPSDEPKFAAEVARGLAAMSAGAKK